MTIETIMDSRLIADLGWTLFHSLWQISIISLALAVILRLLRNVTPNLLYSISVAALAMCVIAPLITFVRISADTSPRVTVRESIAMTIGRDRSRPTTTADPSLIGTDLVGTEAAQSTSSNSISQILNWLDQKLPELVNFVVPFWLLGVAIFSVRLSGGFLQLRRITVESDRSTIDAYWQTKFVELCKAIGIEKPVELVSTRAVATPVAIGIVKPIIVVPASLFLQISPRELETIIVHELIHIRRYDPLVNLAQCFVEALLFFHPGVWWISRQIRRHREFAADLAVIELYKDSHSTYARALANLEEIRLRTDQQMPRYATAANGGNLMQRIQRILKTKTEVSRANSAWTAGLALLLTSALSLVIFSFSSSDTVNAQRKSTGKKLAIGFVTIPPVDRSANAPKDADATARLLIEKLKRHNVPAIGFLQGGMVSDGEKLFPVRANIAKLWIDSGFELGLGGFKHISLYNTPPAEYISNIEKNEQVMRKLAGDSLKVRFFSYPFLNTGATVEDKAKVESWLASKGYQSVKYTFDNNEWMYSYAYDTARNDNDVNTMKEIREAYLAYMSRMFDHFEAYSSEMFGRDIPQTMVLTSSRLVTDTADEFFAMASKRGYSYVTVDEAQKDAAYQTKEDFVGDAGISWFERWASAQGRRLRTEPDVDQFVKTIWNERAPVAKK